jgi:hypothetical protein
MDRAMAEPTELLSIEPRGSNHVLVRTDQHGAKTEIILSETNIGFLARLAPQHLRKILAAKSARIPGVTMTLSIPIKNIRLNTDLHQSEILLAIFDRFGGEVDYSLDPALARQLAERLIARADEVETASKNSTKQ